jgi:hypothetical protein
MQNKKKEYRKKFKNQICNLLKYKYLLTKRINLNLKK